MKIAEIERLMSAVLEKYGQGSVCETFNWVEEVDAIGVGTEAVTDRVAYVCWYPEGYFVSLESFAPSGDPRPYLDAGEYRKLSVPEVVDLIGEHLGLTAA